MERHLPEDWREELARAARHRRVLVLGATDMGKTSFIQALAALQPIRLIDLDPGQKMLGPPGTASLGALQRLDRFIFLGSTSASNLGGIARAAAALAAEAARSGAFAVNTAGFVAGLGARLQAITAKAVAPDLIVEIGQDPAAAPIVAAPEGVPLLRLERSPAARTKPPSLRAAIRQQAFAEALAGAQPLLLGGIALHPGPPVAPSGPARPVCALADAAGADMCLGVLAGAEEGAVLVEAPPPPRPVAALRLGKMWAEPAASGWSLVRKLSPAWEAQS